MSDTLQCYKRRLEHERKKSVVDILMLASAVNAYLGMKKGDKPPMPWDYEPELFEEERKHHEELERERDLEEIRNRRKAFAKRHNEALRMKGGEDNG